MKSLPSAAVIVLGLAFTGWPELGRAQSEREFVFTDEEGHLVVRFPGTGATGLDSSQAEEILNAEFSSMVHDRLRADLLFEAEPPGAGWAASMEPLLERHLSRAGGEFSAISIECRAASCRIVLEQRGHYTVAEHRATLETVQQSIEAFIAAHRQQLEPVFMITAYDQAPETPHIKLFLQRAE